MSDEKQPSEKQPSHIGFSVKQGTGEKSHWQKVGAAWPAKDDGLTVQLDSIPLDGRIVLRSREALEKLREENAFTEEKEITQEQ